MSAHTQHYWISTKEGFKWREEALKVTWGLWISSINKVSFWSFLNTLSLFLSLSGFQLSVILWHCGSDKHQQSVIWISVRDKSFKIKWEADHVRVVWRQLLSKLTSYSPSSNILSHSDIHLSSLLWIKYHIGLLDVVTS